ncbi:FxsA family protein, partial [Baekduia sp.]|uniref:FxsA family protein n=1 Tax=Baekduia sp. TaxID=2600305 RepID=UPI002DFBE579|nr:FxsA family protein [Baekduia sp.]
MPFLLLLALFVVVPILEIYVIIQVGQAIGALWTIVLLIVDSILGSLLMKSQGRAAGRRFQTALTEGRMPAREVLDGVLVIFGG